nr:unnamed protein product [Spirometra erinaceieuropaei]
MRIRLQPRRRPQGKRPPDKLNVALLSLPAHHLHFSNALAQLLDNLPIAAADDAAAAENAFVENRWCRLRDTVQATALAVLVRAPRQHQDWFDDNDTAIRNLLTEKNRIHKDYVDHSTEDNKAAFYRSRRQLQQRLREMQDAWTARKAEEIQGYADRKEWKNFFSAIKAVYGPPTKGTAPLLSADDSTLLTEKTQILQRWAEHFRGVLNRPSVISDAAIERNRQGCPERFTQMVRQLHDGMMARVTDNGSVSETFEVTNGVKQGCVLAPTLFSLMFSAMLMEAYRDERPEIRIAYRTDGHLLNQWRLNFQSRVSTATVHELLFDDVCALNTTSEEEMQRSMDLFSAACEKFGLVINTQKTVVMHNRQPTQPQPPTSRRKSA